MNKCLASFTLFAGLTFLAVNASADEAKIAIVNQQAAIENATCGKSYQSSMQKELDSRQNKLTAKKNELKKKYETLQRDKDILSKKELAAKEREFEKLQQDLQKMHEKFEMELGSKDQAEHQKINKVFMQAVANVSKKNNYAIVLPVNVVFYFGDNVSDITSLVTSELDKISKEQNSKK